MPKKSKKPATEMTTEEIAQAVFPKKVIEEIHRIAEIGGGTMDSEMKKKTLRQISYGLYVVTSRSGDVVGADTVNWLSQASFNPPLVMAAIKRDSNLHAAVEKSGSFAINLLSASQKSLAQDFFRSTALDGNKINGHPFTSGVTGSPILEEVYAYIECRVSGKLPLGDHLVFVGEAVDAQYRRDDKPLEMWDTGWFYGG